MIIVVRRWQRSAGGEWDPLPAIRLYSAPPEAWEFAAQRGDDGPIAPTRDEIIDACKNRYGHVALRGYGNPGDVDVDVSFLPP